MAEFGFFILGAVIGVPAACLLGGLGAYVRAKVCKCDGLVTSFSLFSILHVLTFHMFILILLTQ